MASGCRGNARSVIAGAVNRLAPPSEEHTHETRRECRRDAEALLHNTFRRLDFPMALE